MPGDETIIQAVRAAVEERTQAVVARELEVAESTVKRWLDGTSVPKGKARQAALALVKTPATSGLSDYWRGVLYAAQSMSATTTALLGQVTAAASPPQGHPKTEMASDEPADVADAIDATRRREEEALRRRKRHPPRGPA